MSDAPLRVRYTPHAIEQMAERGISREQVQQIIDNPAQTLAVQHFVCKFEPLSSWIRSILQTERYAADKDNYGPTIALVDAHTGTFCELRSKKTQSVLAAFWARDGKHLVYEATNSIWPSPVQILPGVNALAARAFYSVELRYTNRLTLGRPRRLSDKQVDAMLGIAFLPVIEAWEKENGPRLSYSFLTADAGQVALTQDGRKAFLFGPGVHKKNLDWAPPDKVITYAAIGRHVTRALAANFDAKNAPIWSSDGRWITFFSDSGWCWLNPIDRETTVIPWPDNEVPLQLLSEDGTGQ